jgi:hypothetical protein
MPRSSRLGLSVFATILGLAFLIVLVSIPSPSAAQGAESSQCLSRDECRVLREELREFRREMRPLRQELRQLRRQIRELPVGDERDALIEQARELKREIQRIRRERRPVAEEYRQGCGRECRDR